MAGGALTPRRGVHHCRCCRRCCCRCCRRCRTRLPQLGHEARVRLLSAEGRDRSGFLEELGLLRDGCKGTRQAGAEQRRELLGPGDGITVLGPGLRASRKSGDTITYLGGLPSGGYRCPRSEISMVSPDLNSLRHRVSHRLPELLLSAVGRFARRGTPVHASRRPGSPGTAARRRSA